MYFFPPIDWLTNNKFKFKRIITEDFPNIKLQIIFIVPQIEIYFIV